MMTDDPDDTDDLELRRWREDGKAPAGSCPYCASRISMVERDGFFRARCSHRGCGATGPKMRSITRAADLFCCPPQRTAAGMAISARPTTGTVGELLATAPVGAIVEYLDADGDIWHQVEFNATMTAHRRRIDAWGGWKLRDMPMRELRQRARLVPASEADRDPSTRGPIGEG